MSDPKISAALVIHSHQRVKGVARLLARLNPDELVVSEGTWAGLGEGVGGGPRRLPAYAPQVPALPLPNLRGAIDDLVGTIPQWLAFRASAQVAWRVLEARGTEVQARWAAIQAAHADVAVVLDPFDIVDSAWWNALVELFATHPVIGAVEAPVIAEWWGGEVRDAARTYRTVAVRTKRAMGVHPRGNGVEYQVNGATVTVDLPAIRRDTMAQWESAQVVAQRVAEARGPEGAALQEVFSQQWEAVEAQNPSSRSADVTRAILAAGRAWAALTRGPVPMFVWRDGTPVTEGARRG